MKICKIICLMLALLLVSAPAKGVSAAETDPTVTAGCHSVDASKAIGGSAKLLDTSKAVMLYERTTGTLVYAYNADGRIWPSSMVKLMTALVALERGDPDAVVTVTRAALDSVQIGSVSAGLKRWEEITLRDLLYCMMVGSANDASAVIAEHIGGSQEGFVAMMNEKAEEIGCVGTHFSNAHGLHDSETYTTARDILRILDICLENPDFKAMFEATTYTVPATNKSDERIVTTTNYMMDRNYSRYFDSRVTGGKTGATDAAGRCLAVTANVEDMELIAIVMGAEATYAEDGLSLETFGSFEEMKQLLDHAEKNFECRQLFYEDQVITQYPVEGGSNNVVTSPAVSVYSVLPKDLKAEALTWKYADAEALTAPIAAEQPISAMEVWYGDVCLASTQLVAMNAVAVYEPYKEPQSHVDQKLEEAHGEILAIILGAVFGVAVLVIVAMFLLRMLQMALLRARVRRRRKNRRRNRNARMERTSRRL